MVRLSWLEMTSFRSFEEARIDFPESGLIGICGENPINHESSGSGKTNILLAISYALGFCPLSATDLQTWGSEKDMQVRLGLKTEDGEIVISRGKKNSLKIGERTITGAKSITEGLQAIFKIDPETLKAITYRAQDDRGLFVSLTDSEKKEFLTRLLGLEKIEEQVGKAEEKIKGLKVEIEVAQALGLNLGNDLKRATETLKDLPTLDLEQEKQLAATIASTQDKLKELERDLAKKNKEALSVQSEALKNSAELTELNNLIDVVKGKYNTALADNNQAFQVFRAEQETAKKQSMDLFKDRVRCENEVASLKKILQNKKTIFERLLSKKECPTCGKEWDNTTQVQKDTAEISDFEYQLNVAGTELLNLPDSSELDAKLKVTWTDNPIVAQLRDLALRVESQRRDKESEVVAAAVASSTESINQIKIEIGETKVRLSGATRELQVLKDSNSRAKSLIDTMKRRVDELTNTYTKQNTQILKLESDLALEKDFVAAMGRDGFLGIIFEDVLREIETEVNSRLARLANVSHVTLRFLSEVVTQKGTINRSITPIVSVNGYDTKLKAGLSGGMYSSVEGQIDLAVMAVVQRRAGAMPGFLFLDEVWNGQGVVTKEANMEILSEYARDKLVLVIDHGSEIKEMFGGFIKVVYENERSRIA